MGMPGKSALRLWSFLCIGVVYQVGQNAYICGSCHHEFALTHNFILGADRRLHFVISVGEHVAELPLSGRAKTPT